jgi:hypothetical protein
MYLMYNFMRASYSNLRARPANSKTSYCLTTLQEQYPEGSKILERLRADVLHRASVCFVASLESSRDASAEPSPSGGGYLSMICAGVCAHKSTVISRDLQMRIGFGPMIFVKAGVVFKGFSASVQNECMPVGMYH